MTELHETSSWKHMEKRYVGGWGCEQSENRHLFDDMVKINGPFLVYLILIMVEDC